MRRLLLALVFPVAYIVAASVFAELVTPKLGSDLQKAIFLASSAVVFSWVFLVGLRKVCKGRALPYPTLGTSAGFSVGLAIGLAVSVLSGLLYWCFYGHTFAPAQMYENFSISLMGNLFPASIEEIGFRGGVVGFVSGFAGQTWGLIAGSVPFGLLHFVGRLFGEPVTLQHVVGVSTAGLLLSQLYLRYGLSCAFACHWIWNSLCIQWVQALGIPNKGGVQAFEGAWSTTATLSIFVATMMASSSQFQTRSHSPK